MPFMPIAPYDTKGVMDPSLIEMAENVCYESAMLAGNHNPIVLDEIREMLRIVNSYYSNRIESEGTHPVSRKR